MRKCYDDLKTNAKRRGKIFKLTFEQFKEFAIKVNLLHKRGRTSESYTIDRRDNKKGYTIDNIQMLTRGENTRKGDRKIGYDYITKHGYIIEITEADITNDPF